MSPPQRGAQALSRSRAKSPAPFGRAASPARGPKRSRSAPPRRNGKAMPTGRGAKAAPLPKPKPPQGWNAVAVSYVALFATTAALISGPGAPYVPVVRDQVSSITREVIADAELAKAKAGELSRLASAEYEQIVRSEQAMALRRAGSEARDLAAAGWRARGEVATATKAKLVELDKARASLTASDVDLGTQVQAAAGRLAGSAEQALLANPYTAPVVRVAGPLAATGATYAKAAVEAVLSVAAAATRATGTLAVELAKAAGKLAVVVGKLLLRIAVALLRILSPLLRGITDATAGLALEAGRFLTQEVLPGIEKQLSLTLVAARDLAASGLVSAGSQVQRAGDQVITQAANKVKANEDAVAGLGSEVASSVDLSLSRARTSIATKSDAFLREQIGDEGAAAVERSAAKAWATLEPALQRSADAAADLAREAARAVQAEGKRTYTSVVEPSVEKARTGLSAAVTDTRDGLKQWAQDAATAAFSATENAANDLGSALTRGRAREVETLKSLVEEIEKVAEAPLAEPAE
mmetsp:Transcript_9941/g.29327  ORF Transcript_9941/g.29327 Transcript_9941/m.29327 type:complete len:526 (+) Transcript_9941:81-1658(+)